VQPFHIDVVTNGDIRKELRKLAWDQPQITDATALLVFSAKKDLKKQVNAYIEATKASEGLIGMLNSALLSRDTAAQLAWSRKQTYIAAGFALAAAAELKVASCPMEVITFIS
jgi:nitroreductase